MALRDFFTSPKPRGGQAITAAATIIDQADENEKTRIRRGPVDWQRQAWQFFDDLEAISYPATYVSNALSRLRLAPALRPDPREAPVLVDPDGDDDLELSESDRAALLATVDRLGAGDQPITEIQRLISLNLFIPGDGYLVGYQSPDTGSEVWDVLSVEELILNPNGRGYARRRLQEGGPTSIEALPDTAFICRVYQRHPRFSGWAHSSMRAVLELCDELRMLTDSIRASASSRIPAGVMFLTHGMMGSPPDETQIGQQDEAQNNPVIQRTIEHFETPIKNRKSASAVVPLIMVGEEHDIAAAHIWEPNRAIDSVAAAQRAELISRIAIGLDVPAEILTGKVDLNHWTAWQVSEETFKYHLEPSAHVMVNALTTGYFRPHLAQMGVADTQKYFIWYDSSDLISHPDRSKDAADAYDRFELSGDSLRRYKNFSEQDAPDEEELAERARRELLGRIRITLPPEAGIPTAAQLQTGDLPVSQKTGESPPTGEKGGPAPPKDAAPGSAPPVTPSTPGPNQTPRSGAGPSPQAPTGSGPRGTPAARASVEVPPLAQLAASATVGPVGPRLAQIERTLRVRLLQASDDAMQRALERAGNRLRSLASRGGMKAVLVGDVPAVDVAGKLGPERVAQLNTSPEDLTAGAFTGLLPHWNAWTARAQEQALAAIDEHGDLSDADAEELAQEMAANREHGWTVLNAGLIALAAALVFTPNQPAPERGEFSDLQIVPPGLIRDALITAGGGPDDQGPTDGLMTGTTVDAAIDKAGLTITGYTWEHGDPARPFEPHEALDGVTFFSPDDEVLANGEGWPDVEFFVPGDHDGCLCSVTESVESLADTEPSQ